MAYSFPEIRTFRGLYLQKNSFNVPDGAMEEAANIVISKDDLISKRRGYYRYYDPASGTLNRLFSYQDKLIAAYSNQMAYYTDTGTSPNQTGVQTLLTGETVAITGTRVSRSLQSNNNFYFTTDNGVLKLTAYNSIISDAGAPPGLDISANFMNGSSASWFGGGTSVAYRVLYGYTDANGNLILGAPSDIVTITNTDVELSNDSGVATVITLTVTVTSVAHGLQTGMYLTFTDAKSGSGGSTPEPLAEGIYQITVTGVDSFTYVIPSFAGGSSPLTQLTYAYAMPVTLEFTIPVEISNSLQWFYQVYRSSQQDALVGNFSDFKLVTQQNITAAQYSAEVIFYNDDTPDDLLGAELYTNENSREGELQANTRPPLCDDVTLYKNFAIYASCTTLHVLPLALIDTAPMSSGDYVEIKIGLTTRRYVARTGIANLTVTGAVTNAGGDLQVTAADNGFANGDTVYISSVSGGTLTAGTYFVVSVAAGTFEISLTSGGASIAYGGETSIVYQGVTNGTYPVFYLSEDDSAAVRLAQTAQSLVKAVNRDPLSLVYAHYASTPTEVPGKMRFQSKGFGDPIYMRANSTAVGASFSPVLPDSFISGDQVFSVNDQLPHVFFVSKSNEPEAVPIVNFFTVGAKNKAILRVHALRDSIIVLKQDGVYRVTGDNVTNLSVTLLDGTVHCVAASSSDVLNNQVVFLSNQGVCLVTESSVQIISRTIEDVIQPILGQPNLATRTSGVSYETERLYLLTTTSPNDEEPSVVYAFNILTEGWSTWDTLFKQAVIGPNDILYYITYGDIINRERKTQTKIDYTEQNYPSTVSNVAVDTESCDLTLPASGIPREGDIVVKDNTIFRIIEEPILITGDTYSLVFDGPTTLEDGDSVQLYARIQSRIKFAPFHAGLVGRSKQFSQMQIHMRDNSASRLNISYLGDTYGGSETVIWESRLLRQGWGLFPWGFEPWGQANVINLQRSTQPAPIVRTYVPLFQARNTFIQALIEHKEAGEPLNFQSLSYTVRSYGERVSR